ncbi:MAG: SDR family NAD(P)-dependent oxidoreductase [Casimicrobiaceae bacterium]
MNRYDLTGKNAIVTGGAGGFGTAIARLLVASGAVVSLWDSSADGLEETVASFDRERAARLTGRCVDITDADAVQAAADEDRARFGRIDVLVNNAGILGPLLPLWEISPADMRRVLEVNLVGAYLCMRTVLPIMRAQEARPHRGHVVNVASIQGKEGMPMSGAYSASKAGLISLTKSAGKELAQDAIYVNCITPAAAATAMFRLITPERREDILRRIPMGRLVEVDEVAQMVAWLASDDCSFSTGAVFDLSGGRATY